LNEKTKKDMASRHDPNATQKRALKRTGQQHSDSADILFLSKQVVSDLHKSYLELGREKYLIQLAKSDPRVYAGLLGRIIPNVVVQDVQHTVDIGAALAEAHARANGVALDMSESQVIDHDDLESGESDD